MFEETAEKLLEENPEMKNEFEELKANDEGFSNNAWNQLYWIYKRSPNFEADYRLYPIMRVLD
jgi:hypothetical protein